MTRVLMATADAAWSSLPVEAIASTPGMTLVRSCPDIPDLLAAAVAGLADVAVVDGSLHGIDVDSVATLRRSGVRVVAVAASPDARDWLSRLGVDAAVAPVPEVSAWQAYLRGEGGDSETPPDPDRAQCLVVWGPRGGPGSTTVAIALALSSAADGRRTLLLDLDPDGGTVAQYLGLTEERSGLLAAVRAVNSGTMDEARLEDLCLEVRPELRILGGISRPDQWVELRRGALDSLLELGRSAGGRIVIDAGSDLDAGVDLVGGLGVARNTATLAALDTADRVVAVGAADAIGVGRLLRGLRVLSDQRPGLPVEVVVNRVRPTLGWTGAELVDLIARAAPGCAVHLVPDDVPTADAAMLAARSPWDYGEGELGRELRRSCRDILGPREPVLSLASGGRRRRFRR